jgi:peptidoglycan/xylan/chitin deacetylase (PgdA/CDA1 family)
VATFSQPMNRESVERSFTIRPQVGGQLAWADDFTIRFQPDRLLHGVPYEVEIGGRSARGMRLTGSGGWHFTTVAGPPLVLAPGRPSVKVPILMYHYIRVVTDRGDPMGFALSVTPSDFAAQMEWLAQNGFHPITLEDLNAYLRGERGLPARPVILTFDDGYADFYSTALPILRSHDFSAVAYVVSGFIGRPGYMTAAQVQAADRAGIEIGSHTVDHANLTIQSFGNLHYQLAASKQALEHLLGHPVLSFCYPSGRFNAGVAAAVRAAGYREATTTMFRFVRTPDDRYVWGRTRIAGGENLGQFAAALLSTS